MTAEILFLNKIKKHTSLWMPNPPAWNWTVPSGMEQALVTMYREHHPAAHGMSNLMWLAMDMDTPPKYYNLRDNQLATKLILFGRQMALDGIGLADQAGSLTLNQFRERCLNGKFSAPAGCDIAPLLALLAGRRLEHAHT